MTDSYAVARNVATTPARTVAAHLAMVESEARALMAVHGLDGWRFQWDRAINRAGQCQHARRTLSFSKPNMSGWKLDDCRLTILHEIAHALTPGHNHDRVWRAKCLEIGGNGQRCWMPTADRPQAPKPIVGHCLCDPAKVKHEVARMPTRPYACRMCRTRITWTRRSA